MGGEHLTREEFGQFRDNHFKHLCDKVNDLDNSIVIIKTNVTWIKRAVFGLYALIGSGVLALIASK